MSFPLPGSDAEGAALVLAEGCCALRTLRTVPQYQGLPVQFTFQLRGLKAKQDYRVDLDLGALEGSLRVSMSCAEARECADCLSRTVLIEGDTTLYASFSEPARAVQSPNQITISHADDSFHECFVWGRAAGKVYLAVFAHQPLDVVNIRVNVGDKVERRSDLLQPWCIAAGHAAGASDTLEFKQWFWDRHPALTFGGEHMLDEDGRTPLHHAALSLGDPRIVTIILANYRKFVPVDARDPQGRTALHLLATAAGLAKGTPRLARALALADLLIDEGGADPMAIDNEGWTPLHHAAVAYQDGEDLLLKLATAGRRVASLRNEAGRTPAEEVAEPVWKRPSEIIRAVQILLKEVLEEEEARDIRESRCADDGVVAPPAEKPRKLPSWTPTMRSAHPPKQVQQVVDRPLPPELVVRDSVYGGRYLDEDRLRAEFNKYDKDRNGFLSQNELKAIYRDFEHFGVRESDGEIETLISGMGMLDDGRVSFEEFCILMLKIEAR